MSPTTLSHPGDVWQQKLLLFRSVTQYNHPKILPRVEPSGENHECRKQKALQLAGALPFADEMFERFDAQSQAINRVV